MVDATPSTADCCSRLAQIFSKAKTSNHSPPHFSHSRITEPPSFLETISMPQSGHLTIDNSTGWAVAAAAPQCGQWRPPLNIMPKHEAHAVVASFDSQYWQSGESDEIAAPQFGQLSVSASISTTTSA